MTPTKDEKVLSWVCPGFFARSDFLDVIADYPRFGVYIIHCNSL